MNSMITKKNKSRLAMVLVGILVVTVSVFSLYAFAATINNSRESGGVMVYSFGYDVFQEFLGNPSREILEQKENNTMISVFTKTDSYDGLIKCEIINREPIQVDYGKGGDMKIGNLPVYSSLIDFVNNKESLKKFLYDKGIVGKIEDVIILDIRNMPVTIWLRVNQENYFITVNEKYDDYVKRDDSCMYIYRLYSYLDYFNKFGVKDGKLLIIGKEITAGNYVKIHYSGAYIPFRTVMENLGAKVEWDIKKNAVLLICNDKEYVFEPDKLSLVEVGTSTNILMTPPGGAYYYCKIIDNKIIMNNYSMQVVTRLMGAKINVDYDNLIVEIIQ